MMSVKVVTNIYFGQSVDDPYRYIENIDNLELENWLKIETLEAREQLNKIPKRQYLINKQLEFESRFSFSINKLKITENDFYFYIKMKSNENGLLYYRKGFDGEEKLLYDSSLFKSDSKDKYTINYIQPSWDAGKIAVSLTKNGEEISEIIIIDVFKNEVLPDIITNCWPTTLGGINWLPDNSGFIYINLPIIDIKSQEFLLNTKSIVHKIGKNPLKKADIFSKENNSECVIRENDFPFVYIFNTKDQFIFGAVREASSFSDVYYAPTEDLKNGKIIWKPLFKKSEKIKRYVLQGTDIIFLTAKENSNYQIHKTSILQPNFEQPEILVKAKADEVIKDFELTKDGLYFSTNQNGVASKLYYFDGSKEKEILLPIKSGSISLESKGKQFSELWITLSGWLSDDKRYLYSYVDNNFKDANLVPIVSFSEFKNFIVKEIEISSHDGVQVPLSLIYKKGTKKSKQNPVLFYGYGAYGSSMSPFFSPRVLTWVLEGGILAIPHVRGGREKGELWHQDGSKLTKPNTWKDLIACAEYMIDEKYTTNKLIAIWGISAGGILVGRAMTERPDLFGAVISSAGMMNTLRLEAGPNGANNTKEFGTIQQEDGFKALLEMDSYHHIKNGIDYPATLITAGINDPRVPVWQSAKFFTRLKVATSSKSPVLFAVDFEAGHGLDNSRLKQFEDLADVYSFAFCQLGHPNYQIKPVKE